MEGNRTVDVLIPTYKPDQRCVQLVKTSVKPECSGQSDLFDRYRERDLSKRVVYDF